MSISSAHVIGPVVGIGTITTPSAKTVLKGPPALPPRKGGAGNKHPIRKCCCCLYTVGFGTKRISSILYGTNRRYATMQEWIREEKPKWSPRLLQPVKRPRKPKPVFISQCGRCLYALGLGYSRITKQIYGGVATPKKRRLVAKWMQWERPLRPQSENDSFVSHFRLLKRHFDQIGRKHDYVRKSTRKLRGSNTEFTSKDEKRRRIHYRKTVWLFFTKGLMSKLAKEILGCDRAFFLAHIRAQLSKGLTMENYGKKWHLDHIAPIRFYDLTDFQQVKQCFHYTNYQPLKDKDNMNKSDKRGFSAQLPMVFT
jgi:hypothetical protein